MTAQTKVTPSPLQEEVAAQVLPDADEAAGAFEVSVNSAPASDEEHAKAMSELAFGECFTDHMVTMGWTPEGGWENREVQAFGPLDLLPSAAVLHYSQEIFEGMKAFRWQDGSVRVFRPGFNSARFNQSARRMEMPEVPLEDFIGSLVALVRADKRWVPGAPNTSLYLRPFMIADESYIGVRPANSYLYSVIASPVGVYFKDGLAPVSIYVADEHHRAAPGGTGAAKTGGNYSGSMLPQRLAAEQGYEQVCYLDPATNANLEELGGMNLFVVRKDGTALTPRLTGTILEGGTRSAIIQLLNDRGVEVHEQDIPLADLIEDIKNGDVTEMFACGTAALITPIGRLGGSNFEVELTESATAKDLLAELGAIQRGEVEDRHGWMYQVA